MFFQNGSRKLLAGTEQEHADTFFTHPEQWRDLTMLEALDVGKPQQDLLLRLQRSKKCCRFMSCGRSRSAWNLRSAVQYLRVHEARAFAP